MPAWHAREAAAFVRLAMIRLPHAPAPRGDPLTLGQKVPERLSAGHEVAGLTSGAGRGASSPHVRCWARCLFISNIVTLSLPKTFLSLSSARISRRFSGFCRLFD